MNRQSRHFGAIDRMLTTSAEEARFSAHDVVHVRIWLGAMALDYRTTLTAATNLIRDCHRKRWCAIELILHSMGDSLPGARLPNERLFLEPECVRPDHGAGTGAY